MSEEKGQAPAPSDASAPAKDTAPAAKEKPQLINGGIIMSESSGVFVPPPLDGSSSSASTSTPASGGRGRKSGKDHKKVKERMHKERPVQAEKDGESTRTGTSSSHKDGSDSGNGNAKEVADTVRALQTGKAIAGGDARNSSSFATSPRPIPISHTPSMSRDERGGRGERRGGGRGKGGGEDFPRSSRGPPAVSSRGPPAAAPVTGTDAAPVSASAAHSEKDRGGKGGKGGKFGSKEKDSEHARGERPRLASKDSGTGNAAAAAKSSKPAPTSTPSVQAPTSGSSTSLDVRKVDAGASGGAGGKVAERPGGFAITGLDGAEQASQGQGQTGSGKPVDKKFKDRKEKDKERKDRKYRGDAAPSTGGRGPGQEPGLGQAPLATPETSIFSRMIEQTAVVDKNREKERERAREKEKERERFREISQKKKEAAQAARALALANPELMNPHNVYRPASAPVAAPAAHTASLTINDRFAALNMDRDEPRGKHVSETDKAKLVGVGGSDSSGTGSRLSLGGDAGMGSRLGASGGSGGKGFNRGTQPANSSASTSSFRSAAPSPAPGPLVTNTRIVAVQEAERERAAKLAEERKIKAILQQQEENMRREAASMGRSSAPIGGGMMNRGSGGRMGAAKEEVPTKVNINALREGMQSRGDPRGGAVAPADFLRKQRGSGGGSGASLQRDQGQAPQRQERQASHSQHERRHDTQQGPKGGFGGGAGAGWRDNPALSRRCYPAPGEVRSSVPEPTTASTAVPVPVRVPATNNNTQWADRIKPPRPVAVPKAVLPVEPTLPEGPVFGTRRIGDWATADSDSD